MKNLFFFLFMITNSQGLYSNFKILKKTKPKIKSIIKMKIEDPVNIIKQLSNTKKSLGPGWTLLQFKENLNKNYIEGVSLIVKDNIINGAIAIDKDHLKEINENNLHVIKTGIPELTKTLLDDLNKYNINYDIFYKDTTINLENLLQIIVNIGLIYILVSLIGTFAKGGSFSNIGFGLKMKGNNEKIKIINKESNITTRFKDLAGCDEAKEELEEVVEILKRPIEYSKAGVKIPKGVLLEGPPGTGKTLLARAAAGEAGVTFIPVSGSEFIEMFVGLGAARVRNLFEIAKKNKPAIIFIDEIDTIGRQRGRNSNTGNDEREQTLNQILTNMDGFEKEEGIIVIAATNRADILDSALLRSGRFDRKIKISLPDEEGREKILKIHLKNKKIENNINLNEIAKLTRGFSGADLETLTNEATILSLRNNLSEIPRKCILDAFEKMTIGLPSKIEKRNLKDLELVAYHEAGHALIASLFSNFYEIRKVTIVANKGGAGGYTLFTTKDDYENFPTKKFLLSQLLIYLGGRCAEIILYEDNKFKKSEKYTNNRLFKDIRDLDITTGASNDLKQADRVAREYLKIFGLNNGSLTVQINSERNLPYSSFDISELSKSEKDIEIRNLLDFAKNMGLEILRENKEELKLIAEMLLKKITIDMRDIENLNISFF